MYSLKLNKENFNKKIKFEISDEFFETYTFDRFENAKLQISLFLDRKGVSSNYLLKFKLEGILIEIACDICGDNLDFKIKNETEFIIKESTKINNSDDEIIFIEPKQKVIELNLSEKEKNDFSKSIDTVKDLFNAAKKIDPKLK